MKPTKLMKKASLLLLCWLNVIGLLAQIEGHLYDQTTNESIPFVNIWVQGQTAGTTSDEKGYFKLNVSNPTDTLVFSSIAYKTKRVAVSALKAKVYLALRGLYLETVIVRPLKNENEYSIDKFYKRNIQFYYDSGGNPWRIGKLFEYKSSYQATPFLKEINILTNKLGKQPSLIKLHILKASADINKDYEVLAGDILQEVKRGVQITSVDLTAYQVRMPKEGAIIIVEWLIIDQNKYHYTTRERRKRERKNKFFYEPVIGAVPINDDQHTWIYTRGRWHRDAKKTSKKLARHYQGKYVTLAMELILTD